MSYVEIEVQHRWLERAVRWACRRVNHTIDRAGMNLRSVSERFDDIVMGEIASAAVMQYLVDRGKLVRAYDDVRDDNYQQEDPGWDLAVGPALEDWPGEGDDVRRPPTDAKTVSVKSSRIPDADNDDVRLAIARRDFKILYHSGSLEADLTADFECQVYYSRGQSAFREGLRIDERDVREENGQALIESLQLEKRYGRCYLVGFASKSAILAHSRNLEREGELTTWVSRHAGEQKRMWRAPLSLARLPAE